MYIYVTEVEYMFYMYVIYVLCFFDYLFIIFLKFALLIVYLTVTPALITEILHEVQLFLKDQKHWRSNFTKQEDEVFSGIAE